MRHVFGNYITPETIQETQAQQVTLNISPGRTHQQFHQAGLFTFVEIQFSREGTEFIVLRDVLVEAVIRIMQYIAGQVLYACNGRYYRGLVYGIGAPLNSMPVEQPQFSIRIPGAVTYPSAAIIGTAVHGIAIIGKLTVLCFENGLYQRFVQRLISIE